MDDESVNSLWNILKNAIQQILTNNHSTLCFPELYSVAYTLTQQRHGMMMYTSLTEIMTEHVITNVQPHILSVLHKNLLQELYQTWIKYQNQIAMIADLFVRMDQIYSRNYGIDDVFMTCVILFRDQALSNGAIKRYLRMTLLGQIEQNRKGQSVDSAAIQNVCKMLMILSLGGREVYEEFFEEAFLKTSAKLFQTESQKFLAEESADMYLKRVEDRIREEAERVERCLDISTGERIMQVVDQEMITNHMKTIVDMESSGLIFMLEHKKTQDLARMYRIFSRVPEGLQVMCDSMSSYVRQRGKGLLSEQGAGANPVDQIQSLLELKTQCDHFLTESFNDNKLCKETIIGDFEHIFNLSSNSPEYLSLYIDNKLKKGIKGLTEQEVESFLDKALMLFKFLNDKDLFERYYRKHLSSRLLSINSMPDNTEQSMILRFRTECGLQFTSKLERMFKDISISKVTMEEFCCHAQTTLTSLSGVNITVKVLTAGIWPTQSPSPKCIIPSAASNAFETFRRFYLTKHTGRQLMLQNQLGWADLHATFYRSLKKEDGAEAAIAKHILQVSTFQMTILMLFNHKERLTLKEMHQETDIPERDLLRALLPLLSGKSSQRVLLKEPSSKEMGEDDIFTVNDAFSSKQHKIKMEMVHVKKEKPVAEKKETCHKAEEERRQKIEAAIIRIMKSKKRLQHQALVSEVTLQLTDRFYPAPNVVKRCIEGLIEKEYLARAPEDHKMYTYVA